MRTLSFALPMLPGADDAERTPPARPTMLAQRMELQARCAAAQSVPRLYVGALVAAKPGLQLLKGDMDQTHAMIVWRMLDPSDPFDHGRIERAVAKTGMDTPDVLLAMLDDDGRTVDFMPVPSGWLRLLNAEEQAELDQVHAHAAAEPVEA